MSVLEEGGRIGERRGLAASTIVAVAAALASACAAPNLSRTVGRGNYELRGAVGGPFLGNLGKPVPLPSVYVGGRYGITDWVDIDGNLGVVAAAFGILAMDVAGNFQLYRKPKGLAVATSTRLYLVGDLDDAPKARVYPELGLHLGGPVTRWLNLYGGTTVFVQVRPTLDKPPVLVTPFFGPEFMIPARKNRQHGIALHLSWTNPWTDATSVVDYRPGYGAIGLQLGYRVRFGGLDR
ncbi:MAG: hypothetical protein R3B09_03600 [Nannocystaceae bacterium]